MSIGSQWLIPLSVQDLRIHNFDSFPFHIFTLSCSLDKTSYTSFCLNRGLGLLTPHGISRELCLCLSVWKQTQRPGAQWLPFWVLMKKRLLWCRVTPLTAFRWSVKIMRSLLVLDVTAAGAVDFEGEFHVHVDYATGGLLLTIHWSLIHVSTVCLFSLHRRHPFVWVPIFFS